MLPSAPNLAAAANRIGWQPRFDPSDRRALGEDDGKPNRQAILQALAFKPTNSGRVYGHTLTFSESGSNNLSIITHADPTGLLVATPVEGDPNSLIVSSPFSVCSMSVENMLGDIQTDYDNL